MEHNPFLCDKCGIGRYCSIATAIDTAAREQDIRERRHLAAFLGDCGIASCDVCNDCECTHTFICDIHGGPEVTN